ncbi:MAG: hypothetical protein D6814_11745 [Calditrichaeota bacterium]|nr:MAG: hypothetical protein D6814_11745 [Calditrichota bacterium]
MKLTLSKDEYEVLLPLIECRIAEYFMQIRHAMLSSFKEELRLKKLNLIALREILKNAAGKEVDLTPAQADALMEFLQESLHEIPSEIWHTDNASWRQELKAERTTLQALLNRLEPAPANQGTV